MGIEWWLRLKRQPGMYRRGSFSVGLPTGVVNKFRKKSSPLPLYLTDPLRHTPRKAESRKGNQYAEQRRKNSEGGRWKPEWDARDGWRAPHPQPLSPERRGWQGGGEGAVSTSAAGAGLVVGCAGRGEGCDSRCAQIDPRIERQLLADGGSGGAQMGAKHCVLHQVPIDG